MKQAQILHNPSAGNGKHDKEELMELVKKSGFEPSYFPMENIDDWEELTINEKETIFLAGGDGTVRKLALDLLKNDFENAVPIHVLPLGTANNIAKTLEISTVAHYSINEKRKLRSFDCGKIKGLSGQEAFLEGVGFGIFPDLISKMKKVNKKNEPGNELQQAVKVLIEIVKKIKPQKVKIKVDGIVIKGRFLLVELMNIPYLGPNIKLAPEADPSDGYFDLVLIPKSRRKALVHFLLNMIRDTREILNPKEFVKILRVKTIKMKCDATKMHVDDNLIDNYSGKNIKLDIHSDKLVFVQE